MRYEKIALVLVLFVLSPLTLAQAQNTRSTEYAMKALQSGVTGHTGCTLGTTLPNGESLSRNRIRPGTPPKDSCSNFQGWYVDCLMQQFKR